MTGAKEAWDLRTGPESIGALVRQGMYYLERGRMEKACLCLANAVFLAAGVKERASAPMLQKGQLDDTECLELALNCLDSLAKKYNEPEAFFALSGLFEEGIHVEEHSGHALLLLVKAAESGHVTAAARLEEIRFAIMQEGEKIPKIQPFHDKNKRRSHLSLVKS